MCYSITFHLAKLETFHEIKHFLKQHRQNSPNKMDRIYIVRQNKKMIGIARLVHLPDEGKGLQRSQFWLRGLYILENKRNKGFATQLLRFIENDLEKLRNTLKNVIIYAFPLPHLNTFYSLNNYQTIAAEQLPETLRVTYLNAQANQKNWLCMRLAIP